MKVMNLRYQMKDEFRLKIDFIFLPASAVLGKSQHSRYASSSDTNVTCCPTTRPQLPLGFRGLIMWGNCKQENPELPPLQRRALGIPWQVWVLCCHALTCGMPQGFLCLRSSVSSEGAVALYAHLRNPLPGDYWNLPLQVGEFGQVLPGLQGPSPVYPVNRNSQGMKNWASETPAMPAQGSWRAQPVLSCPHSPIIK